MTIQEDQLQALEEYIREGIACQKAALEGKKRYINRVQVWLSNVCKENNESEPNWLWTMAVAKIYLGTEVRVENDDKFYSYTLAICLQQLNDFRENFYRQKELEEGRLQTKTAIESLKYTQKSLRISIVGLIAAIIVPILVSIVTINCCTSTIKIEGDQFQQLRTSTNVESFKVAPNK